MSLDDSASAALMEPRSLFSAAMADAVPILISYVDRDERYRFVNRAYERWFGVDRSQIEGRTLVEVLGESAYAKLKDHVVRALAGETLTFEGEINYQGAGPRCVEARYVPDVSPDGAIPGYYVLVTDISARKQAEAELAELLIRERRRGALLELGRQLREENNPEAVADRACEILARQLGAPSAGYAEVAPDGRFAHIIGEWIVDGMPPLLGTAQPLDSFGPDMGADLRAGRQVVISDVATDRRTATPEVIEAYGALSIGAFVTAPVIKARRMAAYVYVCQDAPRAWTTDEVGFVSDVAELVWNASARARSETALRKAEETERLLIREVDHRAKNVLAVVQSLAQLTPFENKRQYVDALSGRIGSLARSHSLLSASRWTGVRLDALLRQELEPYGAGADERVTIDGPPVLINAEAAQSLGLVVHELATNASKYGALTDVLGALEVSWRWDDEGRLILTWREASTRPVTPPSRQGFGSLLIANATKQLGARIEQSWKPGGLVCRLEIGKGATPCDGDLAEEEQPAPAVSGLALRDQRVLVVEDEALVAMELTKVLTEAGAHVIGPAGSLEEAMDLLEQGPIDRALLDVNLGGRLVTPLAEALTDKAIPFVYLTGYQDPGVTGGQVLRKPATPELLLGALAGAEV